MKVASAYAEKNFTQAVIEEKAGVCEIAKSNGLNAMRKRTL